MATEAARLDDLLQAWRELASGDRKAILRRLPPDRRRHFQRMLAASPAAGSEEVEQSLRYRIYSPWLGRLLEACENDAEDVALPKRQVRDALMRAHLQAQQSTKNRNERISLFDVLRSTVLEWSKKL